ncbi:Alpha/Beta hydrolase protein [Fomitopsis betulina]|nr:Alpha/Beta hydrolase protein [Fomitopsis betulina]
MFALLIGAVRLLAFAQLATALPSIALETRWANESTPVVNLGYAQYQGTYDPDTDISCFFGIRYAQAPTGEYFAFVDLLLVGVLMLTPGNLRWQAPQTPTTTAGIQQATAQPNECYQAPTGNATTSPYSLASALQKRAILQDEDCLFLNIYTPGKISSAANRPVVVWIHGGGYIAGAANTFTGQDIIKESDYGVVTVIIQYRLGLFGFLAGSEVKANGALNAGLLDQNFALQWVQDHIVSFGGDPTRVTIWGQSAGAGSVMQHIVAHGGQTDPPLFRAAITSSTFLPLQYYYNDTIPEKLFNETVAQANCSSASDLLACLRAADVSALEVANMNLNLGQFFGTYAFVPVVDGTFIVERPTVTLEKRRVNGEMLLAMTNSYEGYSFVNEAMPPTNLTDYVVQLFPTIADIAVQAIVQQYMDDTTLTNTSARAIAVMGESIFICPSYPLMEAFGVNAYKGEFAIPPAHHGQDLQYYFPTANPPAFNNSQLITSISQSFTSIIRFLNPNDKPFYDLKPAWAAWQNGSTEMLFNVTVAGKPDIHTIQTDPALLERCALWQSISSQTNQ